MGSKVGKKADDHRVPFRRAYKAKLGTAGRREVGLGGRRLVQVSPPRHQAAPEARYEGDDGGEAAHEDGEPCADGREVAHGEDDAVGTEGDGEHRDVGGGLPGR